ncbi:cytochrome P450 20A1 [Aplysia californica]|uniref:Cytochrome P450 20A1 n=1 Tax=Aplysia californica TaxID=6500 RepID=A0ABM1W120_APLCA|nr:cytochrome P450 20A1 [Aplysia californica]
MFRGFQAAAALQQGTGDLSPEAIEVKGFSTVTSRTSGTIAAELDGNFSDIARAGSLHEFLLDLHNQLGDIAGFWWGQTYVVSIASPELFKAHAHVFDRPGTPFMQKVQIGYNTNNPVCPKTDERLIPPRRDTYILLNEFFHVSGELFKFVEALFGSYSLQYANGPEGWRRRQEYSRPFSHERLKKYLPAFQEVNRFSQEKANSWKRDFSLMFSGMESQHIYVDTGESPVEAEVINILAENVEKKWCKGESDPIPVGEDMASFSIRSTLSTLMGDSFLDEKLVQSVIKAYKTVWIELERRLTDSVPPDENDSREKLFSEEWFRLFSSVLALQHLHTTVKEVVEHRQENKLLDQQLLIDVILQYTTDEDMLISDIILFMVASFHTSANLLTWAMYFLATHPDVQSKLHSEIVQVLGQKGAVTDSNFGQLRYLQQVLQETLRCAVVSPWGARVQDVDSVLGGHKVPKNTPVIHALGVVLQNEKLWPLPKRFDPDRFSTENSKDQPTYAFSPFGFAGKRTCPGYKFANRGSTVLIATLIKKFEVSMWSDQVVKPVFGLVTRPHEEILLKVSRRK